MFEQSVHGEMVQFSIDTGLHIALKGRAGYSRCQWLTTTANRSNQNQKDLGRCMNAPTCHTLGARGFARDLIETTMTSLAVQGLVPMWMFPMREQHAYCTYREGRTFSCETEILQFPNGLKKSALSR